MELKYETSNEHSRKGKPLQKWIQNWKILHLKRKITTLDKKIGMPNKRQCT